MTRKCPQCSVTYDDVDNTTICPHEPLRSPEMKKQWDLGRNLLGKIVRFRHMPPGSGSRCTSLYFEGMVGIEALPGEFAPHLFIEDEGAMPGEHTTKTGIVN